MQYQPIDTSVNQPSTMRIDILLAVVLAIVLSVSWAINDWARISWLTLPDADDMMRLAQVRDWIAGQSMNDWTQYRMAPPDGAPMHWSRINDFVLAAIILAATPLVGQYGAELAAVLIYPALLLMGNIVLSARIARRLWSGPAGPIAAILAGLAYPGTTLFVPGRIDHHALQVITIQLTVLALMRGASAANGALAGLSVAFSLMIGLETAPQIAVLIGTLFAFWTVHGPAERERLAAFAVTLGATTMVFFATMRPTFWSRELCDAFTPASVTAILSASGALAALAVATPRLQSWQARAIAGILLGGTALGATLIAFPGCLTGPYGEVDPFLRANFIVHIDEANSIFSQQSLRRAISLAGMVTAACVAAAWMFVRQPRRWATMLPIVAVIGVSALITLVQVRGTYVGAPLSAPVLAGVVLVARQRTTWRTPALIGAWFASAGIVYAAGPRAIDRMMHWGKPVAVETTPQIVCSEGDVWQQMDRYPPGVIMAPTNMASYLIGSTHMSTVGAGYHRNNRGNMAMYRYFLSTPAEGAPIARQWNVTYVAFCPGDFSEIDVTRRFPDSLAAMLSNGRAPEDFEQLPLRGARLRLYRIAR